MPKRKPQNPTGSGKPSESDKALHTAEQGGGHKFFISGDANEEQINAVAEAIVARAAANRAKQK